MPIVIPNPTNYPSPLVAVPAIYQNVPREGVKMIPVEIDWGNMGGASNAISVNLQNNATLEFSQIVALSVDNSQCGADVQFIFPDTSETMTIPAYSPKTILEVFTNQTQFYLYSPGAIAQDFTRFSIHNSLPPPIAVPFTVEQLTASIADIASDGVATTQMIPNTVFGTLEYLRVFITHATLAGNVKRIVDVVDGTGAVLAKGQLNADALDNAPAAVIDMQNIHFRFQQGLKLVQSGTAAAGGAITVNLGYRIP